MPVFPSANAGITSPTDSLDQSASPVTLGVTFGLMGGKVFGIIGICYILIRFKWVSFPEQTRWRKLFDMQSQQHLSVMASIEFKVLERIML